MKALLWSTLVYIVTIYPVTIYIALSQAGI